MTPKVFKFVDESEEKLSKLQELMIITMEECSELIQECSKSIRMGDYNRSELKDEIGDVLCMIELLKSNGLIDGRYLKNRVELKRMKLMKWSDLIE